MTSHLKKVELHCHLEGAAPPALTLAQARKYNVDISAYLKDGAYVWHDFASFLECYDKKIIAEVDAMGSPANVLQQILTHIVPVRTFAATRCALLRSCVHTIPARP